MNKQGIICIETEWEHTEWYNRLPIQTKPLLEFVEKAYNCPIIYRRVATFSELKYYLGQFNKAEYDNYRIFYLSFHGDTQIIQLEGEPGRYKTLTLEELSRIADGAFDKRILHFSSCKTLSGYYSDLDSFKNYSGALMVSGYTKSVNCVQSTIHDIAYLSQLLQNYQYPPNALNYMSQYYGELGNALGFRVI